MSKQYKFLLLITIIALSSIWYISVKKDDFREEELKHIGQKLKADTMRDCLHEKGFKTVREADPKSLKECRLLAEKKWQEAHTLNRED